MTLRQPLPKIFRLREPAATVFPVARDASGNPSVYTSRESMSNGTYFTNPKRKRGRTQEAFPIVSLAYASGYLVKEHMPPLRSPRIAVVTASPRPKEFRPCQTIFN